MKAAIDKIEDNCAGFNTIYPVPEWFRATHDSMIEAGAIYKLFAAFYIAALSETDGDKMAQAITYLVEGNASLDEAFASFPQ